MGQHSIEKCLTGVLIYIEELKTVSNEINMQNINQQINK